MDALVVLGIACLFATPVVVLILLSKTNRLAERLDTLNSSVVRLVRQRERELAVASVGGVQVTHAEPPERAEAPEAAAPPAAEPAPAEPAPPAVPEAPEAWVTLPPSSAADSGPPTPEDAHAAPAIGWREPAPKPSAETLETAIGQKWLVRVGALILVTGAGFFYAYAIDQGWISEAQRAISGAIVGLGVMALGIFFNRRGFAPLAQGFVACGSALLFLDALAAHRFYHLISAPVALAAIAAVTALTAAIALRWSAIPLVVLSQIGGYLGPFLLADELPDRGLVTLAYVLVLDAGFLFVAAIRRWPVVFVIAAAATAILYPFARSSDPQMPAALLVSFACAFDLLFLAMAAIPAAWRRLRLDDYQWVIVPALAIGAALAAEHAIAVPHPTALLLTLGGLALAHAGAAELLRGRSRDGVGAEVLRICAGGLLVDAIRFVDAGPGRTLAFAAAGVALSVLARLRGSTSFRVSAAAAFTFAIARVFAFHLHGGTPAAVTPFLNSDFAVGVAVALALFLAAISDRPTRWIGWSAASLLGAVVLTGEIAFALRKAVDDPAYAATLVTVARTVAATSVAFGFATAAGRSRRWVLVFLAGLSGLVALVGFGLLLHALQRPPQVFLFNPVCLGALFVPLGLLLGGSVLKERLGLAGAVFLVVGALLPLVVTSIEAYRFFHDRFASARALVDAGSAAVSVTWAAYAALLLAIGISRRLRAVRLSALALLGITLIKVVMVDLAQLDRLARIASFVALGVVLMTGAWAYHRFSARIFGTGEDRETLAGTR